MKKKRRNKTNKGTYCYRCNKIVNKKKGKCPFCKKYLTIVPREM